MPFLKNFDRLAGVSIQKIKYNEKQYYCTNFKSKNENAISSRTRAGKALLNLKEENTKILDEKIFQNSPKVKKNAKRWQRCKTCPGCLAPKCGNCKMCLNPKLKKACINRTCSNKT